VFPPHLTQALRINTPERTVEVEEVDDDDSQYEDENEDGDGDMVYVRTHF